MQENFISVRRTARYFSLGDVSDKTQNIWIVCHGYGQLARYFLKNFTALQDDEMVIIAPEALSRFYLSGTSGRIGATWMTSEDRLHEIDDYVDYLEDLLKQILKDCPSEVKIFVLGFSQGTSTVCRWISRSRFTFHGVVLWAGTFPQELTEIKPENSLLRVPILMAAGTNDPFLTQQTIEDQISIMQQAGLQPEVYYFSGKHEINQELLLQFHRQFQNS